MSAMLKSCATPPGGRQQYWMSFPLLLLTMMSSWCFLHHIPVVDPRGLEVLTDGYSDERTKIFLNLLSFMSKSFNNYSNI